ncbi:MAG: phosphate starvation-inducible protein PhoH, partial [Paludibacteraceae bacterium]|nr:phosphate starvation-inducible protein PhoH [Paludibacteraceae bacterium]
METILTLQENIDTPTFYGVNNQNFICLKNQHPDVRIVARGYQIKVSGSDAAVNKFAANLRAVEAFCAQHNTLNEEQILQLVHGERPHAVEHDNLILHGVNGKPIL